MICKLCNEEHGRTGGHFNRHLKNKHNINSYIDYIIDVDYNGVRPKCECGCGEYTTYFNNNFKNYVHGHNSQHQYDQICKYKPNEKIRELYKNGKSGLEISVLLKQSIQYVYKVIKNGDLIRNMSDAKRIYNIDQNIFDKIDTEEKAYWLGFLFADGYNNEKRGTIALTLHERDMNTLHGFSKFLKTNKPINKNSENSFKVVIESKHMSKTLSSLGVIQRKTHFLEFPNIEKHLVRHFIRGYFDGDGCVTYGKKIGYFINISIVSTKTFLSEIVSEIGDIKFWFNKRHKDRDDNIYTISSAGVSNIIKFYHYLYNDSNIYMDRKKNKFDEWFEWYFKTIKKPHNKTIELKKKLLDNKN